MSLSPHNSVVLETKAHLRPNLGLGSVSTFIVDHGDFKACNGLICKEGLNGVEHN